MTDEQRTAIRAAARNPHRAVAAKDHQCVVFWRWDEAFFYAASTKRAVVGQGSSRASAINDLAERLVDAADVPADKVFAELHEAAA